MRMATTLAGNLTLLGSVANLIVTEMARNRGVVSQGGRTDHCGDLGGGRPVDEVMVKL